MRKIILAKPWQRERKCDISYFGNCVDFHPLQVQERGRNESRTANQMKGIHIFSKWLSKNANTFGKEDQNEQKKSNVRDAV